MRASTRGGPTTLPRHRSASTRVTWTSSPSAAASAARTGVACRPTSPTATRRCSSSTGLPPITPLLVAQVQSAFSSQPGQAQVLERLAAGNGALTIGLRHDSDVEVTVYRLDRLFRTHQDTVLSRRLARGTAFGPPRQAGRPPRTQVRGGADQHHRGLDRQPLTATATPTPSRPRPSQIEQRSRHDHRT